MEVSLIVQQVLLFLPWKLDQTFSGVNSWVLAVIATFNFHWVLRKVFFQIKFKYWIYDRSFNNKLIKCNSAWSLKESDRTEWLNWTEWTHVNWASLVTEMVKNPPAMQETWLPSMNQKEMVTHPSILAWKSHGQRTLVGCSPWSC